MDDRKVPTIFSRRRSAAKWRRARYHQLHKQGTNFLTEAIADDIAERVDFMRIEAKSARIVGDQSGALTQKLNAQGCSCESAQLGEFDEVDTGPLGSFDLFVHLLGLGHVNDLPGALIRACNELNDGGLFIAAFPGAGSLPILRQLALEADGDRPAARMHPLVDNRAGTALLERAGFKRQVVDSYPIRVRYSSLYQLIADLRDQGLTASLASPAPLLSRAGWEKAKALFDDMRDENGKVTETFEILTLTGWR